MARDNAAQLLGGKALSNGGGGGHSDDLKCGWIGNDKRYDSIGSDPAHARTPSALSLIAGSLSIEPFGPSHWRLRRTRPLSYVLSIVRTTGVRAYYAVPMSEGGDGDADGAGDGDVVDVDADRRADLRRRRVRAWHQSAWRTDACFYYVS